MRAEQRRSRNKPKREGRKLGFGGNGALRCGRSAFRFLGGALPTGAEEGERQHREKDNREAQRGPGNGTGTLRHDGERAVNEFDVHPIDQE